jgi:pyrroloquinoline quinone biosynthesis protein A
MVAKAIVFFQGGKIMQWTTPSYTDMRFGFEVTMYIATR